MLPAVCESSDSATTLPTVGVARLCDFRRAGVCTVGDHGGLSLHLPNVVEHLCVHVLIGPLHLFFFEGPDAALYPELSSFSLPSQEHLVTCLQGHQPQLGSPSA